MKSTEAQLAWVRELTAQEMSLEADRPAVTGWLQRLCRAAVLDLPAMGVGISLLSQGNNPVTVAASSPAIVLIEELQFALAEGPCIDAGASRALVLGPDLRSAATTLWPAYGPAALQAGVRAVFAFPLQIGAARIGALDIYRDHPGRPSAYTLACASAFAEVAVQELLGAGRRREDVTSLIDDCSGNHTEVHEAQGMVMVQLGMGASDALARLRAHAYTHDRTLNDVAGDVVNRRMQLDSDS